MASIRFRLGASGYLLAPASDVRRLDTREDATRVAAAILEVPGQAAALGIPPSDRTVEGVAEALLAGRFNAVRVDAPPRLLDSPSVIELATLADAPIDQVVEPPRPTAWVGVHVVDQRGRRVPFFVAEIEDAAGQTHTAELDKIARAEADKLPSDGSCTVTLTPKPS